MTDSVSNSLAHSTCPSEFPLTNTPSAATTAAEFPELAPEIIARLRDAANRPRSDGTWPEAQFQILREAGVLRWCLPVEQGGMELGSAALLDGYLQIAEACLLTAFVLTQRNGACQRIADSQTAGLRDELLPLLARGERFATVGISHLTTSRQHWQTPAVQAEPCAKGFRLTGNIPWVTGADHADFLVTGGTLPDNRQVLVLVSTTASGVTIASPAELLGLNGSRTASVELTGVEIESRAVLAGPVELVMKHGSAAGTGSLVTTALAIGLTRSALRELQHEAERRTELAEILQPLTDETSRLTSDMRQSARDPSSVHDAASLRTRANSLVLRATQALLVASKGAGYVEGHPAERYVRQALFFLVWSCPQPVVTAALRELATGVRG